MIKKIALLFALALLSACNDINYDSETRLVVQGKLSDREGHDIPNQSVEIVVFDDTDSFWSYNDSPNPNDMISYGYSDESGQFKFAIPEPKSENYSIGVRINHYTSRFQTKEFLLIKKKDFNDYRLDLGSVTLYTNALISTLVIDPQTDDPLHELSKLTVEGISAEKLVYFNTIPGAGLDLEKQLTQNQTATIHYEVTDHSGTEPVVTQHNVNVAIGNQPTTNYTLHF